MSVRIQEVIHRLEEGGSSHFLRYLLAVSVMLAAAVTYNLTNFRNLLTQEGMDAAQLARNIAEGKGYTTYFIRPFSMHLLEAHLPDRDPLFEQLHPDLANAPLHPALLALWLKAMPFGYPDLSRVESFSIYLPDLWIAIGNQLLFLVAVCLLYRLAYRLFDEQVAWLSAGVFLGAELSWRFSLAGSSTLLLIVLLLVLVEVLARWDSAVRTGGGNRTYVIVLSALTGLIVGLMFLTRYAFGVLIVPLVTWLITSRPTSRGGMATVSVLTFLVVAMPWIARNYAVSGTPLGTAGFAVCHNTSQFSGDELERSLEPRFRGLTTRDFTRKFVVNSREIIRNDLPKLGGSWVCAFFLVGLLVRFRNPTLGRVRTFLLFCLVALAMAQALGRTALSAEHPEVNSENLLAALAPLVFMFGVSLFLILLAQIQVNLPYFRHFVVTCFVGIACLPFILVLLPPHPSPVVYPPYYPPWIAGKAGLVPEGGVIMSDIPWAVGWYGRRPSVWLPLKYQSEPGRRVAQDFLAIHGRKPLQALYITMKTMKDLEASALWRWVQGEPEGQGWDDFIVGVLLKREVPAGFPLRAAPQGVEPEIFLTDSERGAGKTIQSK